MKQKVFVILGAVFLTVSLLITSCNSTKQTIVYENELPVNPAVKTAVLDNGLTYYVMSNSEPKNRIFIKLVVNAGACNEDEDQNGIAHLCEHMAFDGTEHFKKDEIDQFFRTIGSEENNAFTNYLNTVYHFEIPADDKEMLEKAMLIVHDWACAVSYEEEALNNERNVVIEEWRLDQGVNNRVNKALEAYTLKDSKFLVHDVIGDPEILKNISRDRVYDFYKKWYRPELMSVIVVGDLPQNELEDAVIKAMKNIPASETKTEREVYTVPVRQNKEIVIYKDKELKNTLVNIDSRLEGSFVYNTPADYYEYVLFTFVGYIFNQRIQEISKKADSPWVSAGLDQKNYATNTNALYLWFRPKDGQFEESFKKLMDEYERFMKFGATNKEIERMRLGYNLELASYKKQIKDITSDAYTWDFVNHFEFGQIPISPDCYYTMVKDLLKRVTPEDIMEISQKYFGDKGDLISVTAPETEEGIPSEERIMQLWTEYQAENLTEVVEEEINETIMERPAATKVASKKKVNELGVTEYTLANGVKIITKKTDFEKDSIQMTAISKGGFSLVSDEEYESALAAVSYSYNSGIKGFTRTQLDKLLTTKIAGISYGVNINSEFINASGNNEDFEIALQLINQLFTNPQFTQEGWDKTIVDYRLNAKNRGITPSDIFRKTIKEVLYDNSRNFTIVDDAFVDKMNQTTAEKVFKERFADISDFEFVFVGDFNEKNLVDLCSRYLGSIKTNGAQKENTIYEFYKLPQGTAPVYVNKETEHKATVLITFRSNLEPQEDLDKMFIEDSLVEFYIDSLNTQLFDYIRKELGGTYGASVYIGFEGEKERQYDVNVEFGCEPERVEELSNAVINYFNKLKKDGVEKTYVDQCAEGCRRTVETLLRDNNWWKNRIINSMVQSIEPVDVIKKAQNDIPAVITKENFDRIAKEYIDTENYYRLVLMPQE